MSFVNIISAVGNNASICPLIVRDCGIEVPSKVAVTYKQNLKDSKEMAYNATRERLIDEYGTSLIWLGGIPVIDAICNKGIEKFGYNPNISSNLLKDNSSQNLEKNIEKFKNLAPEEVKDLTKILNNKSTYKKLLAGKFILSTTIPVALMGYFLPKYNFALTKKLQQKQNKKTEEVPNKETTNKNPSFKGLVNTLSTMSTVNKMALTDGGLTIGRVSTARNKFEKMEMGFKMGMMMLLNFVTPIVMAKGLDRFASRLFNVNVNLDPKILNDKNFRNSIKEKSIEIPKNSYLNFIDSNPNSEFSKLCEKYCDIKFLKNRIRDPRKFVDEKKIEKFAKEIEKFNLQATQSNNIDKFARKALFVKSGNILANVGISSFLLAYALPKLTFALRKIVTGSEAEPGLLNKTKEA